MNPEEYSPELQSRLKKAKTQSEEMLLPAYAGFSTFFRLPRAESLASLDLALVGVPFDGGVTVRPGARFGPRALREQSLAVFPPYHHQFRFSPFDTHRIADLGDVPIQDIYHLEASQADIGSWFRRLRENDVRVVAAGGDHSVTLPILEGTSLGGLALIHFDAHCDTAPPHRGSDRAHGSPMRIAAENGWIDPQRTVQIGIRGGDELLWEYSYRSGMRVIHIEEFYELGWKGTVAEIRRVVGDTPAYISFDIDALDPAYAPGTGTPVSGGMTAFEAQQTLRGLAGLNFVGADLVEVSPPWDPSGITAIAGCYLLWDLLCLLALSPAFPPHA